MKKAILMSMENMMIQISPAKYQLLDQLKKRGFETYLLGPGKLDKKQRMDFIDQAIDVRGMSHWKIRKCIMDISPQVVIATLYFDTEVIYPLPFLMKKTSFYYYNLEIYTPYIDREMKKEHFTYYINYKLSYPVKKIKEIVYTRMVEAFTIQDPLRKKLSKKYHIEHPNTMLIPNSYVFDEEQIAPVGKCGVIYTGGIFRDFLVEQFDSLAAVKNVPLTFSGLMDPWCLKKIKKLRNTNPEIEFKRQTLTVNEYTDYIKQFAVGLVWYSPLKEDETHYYIGLSSGKMFKYLSLGQPIIAVKCPGISAVVNKYKLGVVVDNITELPDAYETIMRDYSYYRKNVIKTYREKFDFKKTIVPFLDCIEKTIKD